MEKSLNGHRFVTQYFNLRGRRQGDHNLKCEKYDAPPLFNIFKFNLLETPIQNKIYGYLYDYII